MFLPKSRDHGTLGHLFSILGRLPCAKHPKKDLDACMDALQTIFKGHLIAAACEELGIESPDDTPEEFIRMKNALCMKEKLSLLVAISNKVADRCTIMPESILKQTMKESKDGVYNYARKLCHCAAICLEFTDAWAEGDGERVIRCWKLLLLHFHASNRTKYALEALMLQFQLITLPPSLVHQLTWGRFVNSRGGPGQNIPCDLYNEHVNKLFKGIIERMGANFTEKATTRVARSMTAIDSLSTQFDEQIGLHPEASAHSTKTDKDDINKVVKVVLSEKLLQVIPGRSHSNFTNVSSNPLKNLDWEKLHTWISQKAKCAVKSQTLSGGVLCTSNENDEEDESDDSEESDDET